MMAKIDVSHERYRLFSGDLHEALEAYRALRLGGWQEETPREACRMAVLDERFGDCRAYGLVGDRQLVAGLYLYRDRGEIVDQIFKALGQAQDPMLIGDLVALFNVREGGVAKHAGHLVSELWRRVFVGDLRRLDVICRRHTPSWYLWHGPQEVDAYFQCLPSTLLEPARSGVASFHNNGYIRERAVRSLANLDSKTRLPLLMIRMTDWVEPVLRAAQQILAEDISSAPLSNLVGAAALRETLALNARYQSSGLDEAFRRRLDTPEARSAFAEAMGDRDAMMRRFVIRLGLSLPAVADVTVELAQKDRDPTNRLQVARWMKANYASTMLRNLEALLIDPSAAVRSLAYQVLRAQNLERFREKFEQGLLDLGGSVRGYIQYFAGKEGMNCQEIYAKALDQAQGKQLVAAVYGWAETGGEAKRLEPFVKHARTKVRRAAIRGLARLDPRSYTELFQKMLASDNPGVSREGMAALTYDIYSLPQDWFWSVLEQTDHLHVRCNVYRLLALQNKWDAMTALARGLTEPQPVRQVVEPLLAKILRQPPWVFPRIKAARVATLAETWAGLDLGRFAGRMHQLLDLARAGKL